MSGISFIEDNKNDIGKISNDFASPKFLKNVFVPLESYAFLVREMNKKKLGFQKIVNQMEMANIF